MVPNRSARFRTRGVRAMGLAALAAATAAVSACGSTVPPTEGAPGRVATEVANPAVPAPTGPVGDALALRSVARLRPEVIATYPHDPAAFTQGLVALDADRLLESTGLYGESTLREVDLATGEVLRRRDLPPDLFAEGLAVVDGRALQLTWREEVVLVHDLEAFALRETVRYAGEGWGLCHDGSRLVMSDGTSRLTFRDPVSFAPTGSVTVTAAGRPVSQLNELECVGDRVYANVWQTDWIAVIDPASGQVEAAIDAAGLLPSEERAAADVLNGIALRPGTETFLLTGKLWPRLFEVRFVAESGS